jgi:hypothetical protein
MRLYRTFSLVPKPRILVLMSTPSKKRQTQFGNHKSTHEPPADGGRLIVLTAPLTEAIDHAGYFHSDGMASLPIWMEGVINRKYPKWRDVEHNLTARRVTCRPVCGWLRSRCCASIAATMCRLFS